MIVKFDGLGNPTGGQPISQNIQFIQIRVTANNNAGSTSAVYNFTTMTVQGGT